MATALFTSVPCPSSSRALDKNVKNSLHISSRYSYSSLRANPFRQRTKFSCKRLNFYLKAENRDEPISSSLAIEERQDEVNYKKDSHIENGQSASGNTDDTSEEEKEKLQELDWKTDEEFRSFMGNRAIEAAIKLERKRAERKFKQLDRERRHNPLVGFFNNLFRWKRKEKESLEKAEEIFKPLDLNKLKSCFGLDTFLATDVRRFGDGGIFIGRLSKPVEEVIPKLEKKLSEAVGREVVVWLMEETTNETTKQACVVQPKSEIDLQFESTKLSTRWGYICAIALCIATYGTICVVSGLYGKPTTNIHDFLSGVELLICGLLTILAVSEIATRITAARYGVKLSPSFLIPSTWTGSLGVMNNYESLLPNKKALFDIPAARIGSAYLTSLVLAVAAFVSDGGFSGGKNVMYIKPQFFNNNPFLTFMQYMVVPYVDMIQVVFPVAFKEGGVPVNPLAFAGLLGMIVTSLNMLPCGRLEGGRIAQAMFGRRVAHLLSLATSLVLGVSGLGGSVLCLAWGLFAALFRGGDEIPAKDEITPLGDNRFTWGCTLFLLCCLTLFPNGAGIFASSFSGEPYFRVVL